MRVVREGGRGRQGVMKSGSEKEREEMRERVMKGGKCYKGNEGEVNGIEGGMDGLRVLGRRREEGRD